MALWTSMADLLDDPPVVEALWSPSAWRQLPDAPDSGWPMEIEGEKVSRSCGENAGRSGGGEDGMQVIARSSDCKMAVADPQDCVPTGVIDNKENAAHGRAHAPRGREDEAAPSGLEDGSTPPSPEIVVAAHVEGAANDVADRVRVWLEAIEAKNCRSLLKILEAQNDLESRTLLCFTVGDKQRSALHVAAMQGCFRLAMEVIDLVCRKYSRDLTFRNTVSIDGFRCHVYMSEGAFWFIFGVDMRSGLSAFEMANDIVGNTSISQYILYMGSRKKGVHSGMYEAYEGTEWHTALARGDCRVLSDLLLDWNSRCLLETCGGISVLDVAILQGDEKLVKQVKGLFSKAASDGDPEICWDEESYFPSKLKWDQIAKRSLGSVSTEVNFFPGVKRRKRLQSVKSASELAEKLGNSEVVKELLRHEPAVQDCGSGRLDAEDESVQQLLRTLSTAGLFENDKNLGYTGNGDPVALVPLESRLPEFRRLFILAESIEGNWNPEWTEGFLADVDYNFEDRRSLRFSILRLHYACKYPGQYRHFVYDVLTGFHISRELGEAYTWPVDGQGRTPLHTMVDHYVPNDESLRNLKLLHLDCDSRGRSPMIRAITKQFLEQGTMISSHLLQFFYEAGARGGIMESIKHEKLRDCSQSNVISMVPGLYLRSFLYEDLNALGILTSKEEYINAIKAFLDSTHVDSSRYEGLRDRALFIAAALGNQALLREWFKFKCDCMVYDRDGRTALHYAVDGNAPQYNSPPTSFFCSIEYPKKVKEKWEKKHLKVGKANENIEGDTNGTSQSNASVGRKACILMLLQAGVDLSQDDKKGNIPDPGASNDTEFQSWWYNIAVKDSEDKKNSFNQAGNALSVVGTLVAATSYIGPLQPPLNYGHDGYVDTSRSLVKVFMWTNTLAFYLAVASVMFAVVPSLPMPQEGVLDELRRARHTVSSSLFLLLASIGCILVSFAAATAVVVDNGDYYEANDFLLSPSIIGWFFCVIAMVSFFMRVMRLVFYRNQIIRQIYKFRFSGLLQRQYQRIVGS